MTPKLKELLSDFKKEQQSKRSKKRIDSGNKSKKFTDKEGQSFEETQTEQNEVDMGEDVLEKPEEDQDLISLL